MPALQGCQQGLAISNGKESLANLAVIPCFVVVHCIAGLIALGEAFAYAKRILSTLTKWVILHKPPRSRSGLRSLR
jgi:hypothetical protein